MLFLLSPAKKLEEHRQAPITSHDAPALLADAQRLIDVAKNLSPQALESLMRVSEKIALLTAQRFSDFSRPFTQNNAKPALFLFNGDAYEGLAAYERSPEEYLYLDQHLIILSGLYGAIKALDLIQPYRLEMGTKLKTPYGNTLYEFWAGRITEYINQRLKSTAADIVVNLASKEYFQAVQPNDLNATVITPIFQDLSHGQYKTISFYAKRARGLMVQYASSHNLQSPEALKDFDLEGYYFSHEHQKNANEWIFRRDQRP